MKTLFPAAALLLLAACSGPEQVSIKRKPLELVEYAQLPPFPASLSAAQNKIVVLFDVAADGRVVQLRFITSSGSSEWDREAVDSLRRWRFVPTGDDAATEMRRIMDTIIIRFDAPMVRMLNEIRTPSIIVAESIFGKLEKGADFDSLAVQTEGMLRAPVSVDITQLPPHLWMALKELRPMQHTKPLRVGEGYTVYRRVDSGGKE